MRLNKVTIGICIVAAILVVAIIVSSTPKTYSNDRYGFSIRPPAGWKIKENVRVENFTIIVAFIGPTENNFAVNINIYSERTNQNLQEYTSSNKESLNLYVPEFNLISEKNRIIGNIKAYEIVYTAKVKNVDLKFEQVVLIKNNRSYIITFTNLNENFDKYIAVFEKSVDTFKFL